MALPKALQEFGLYKVATTMLVSVQQQVMMAHASLSMHVVSVSPERRMLPIAEGRVAPCRGDAAAWEQFMQQAEAVKVALSSNAVAQVELGAPGQLPMQVSLTRDDFVEATWGLRPRLWGPLTRLGQRACVTWRAR